MEKLNITNQDIKCRKRHFKVHKSLLDWSALSRSLASETRIAPVTLLIGCLINELKNHGSNLGILQVLSCLVGLRDPSKPHTSLSGIDFGAPGARGLLTPWNSRSLVRDRLREFQP